MVFWNEARQGVREMAELLGEGVALFRGVGASCRLRGVLRGQGGVGVIRRSKARNQPKAGRMEAKGIQPPRQSESEGGVAVLMGGSTKRSANAETRLDNY